MNTSPPTFNVERHNQIIEQIEKHPETWKQSEWHCGTAHCYAGWAQIFSGRKVCDTTARRDAIEWLGLTVYESFVAFSPSNTLELLKSIPKLFSYGRDGFNRDGVDRNGYDWSGRDRYGFDRIQNRKNLYTFE
jgi:hypothetical protein